MDPEVAEAIVQAVATELEAEYKARILAMEATTDQLRGEIRTLKAAASAVQPVKETV